MKRLCLTFLTGAFVFIALSGVSVMAQNAVCNPLFQTQNMQHWENLDPTIKVVIGSASLGMNTYCCRKYPGTAYNNNAMTQDVFLVAGQTYEFSANIASKYCSS